MRPTSRITASFALTAATAAVATVVGCSDVSSKPAGAPTSMASSAVTTAGGPGAVGTPGAVAPPAHVVVVIEENHSYSDIVGDTTDAPYLNSLASQGALMTSSFAISHPSEPNYLALFAGSSFGVSSDACPLNEGDAANLGSELLGAGRTFKGYSEGLPEAGSTVCTSGSYARKHVPWVNFTNVPAADSLPFTAFPTDYAALPTVSFVIPDLIDDMHDGTVAQGDSWLKRNLSAYATWAASNNSLLVVTWDEDDNSQNNQIPTLFAGAHVKPGRYSEKVDHYSVLATLETLYGLPRAGSSANATPITDIFN